MKRRITQVFHLPNLNSALISLNLIILLFVSMFTTPRAFAAQSAVGLGTAGSYGVLAGDAITNTGATTINGDLGLYPGTSVIGSPTVSGSTNVNNAAALAAKNDLRTAFLDAAGRTGPTLLAGGTLGGRTLVPGLYKDDGAPAALSLTGTLILDAGGDPNAVWIFQSASSLTSEAGGTVTLINGAQPCNVFWQVGSAATLKTGSTFVGTIMASNDITLQNSAVVNGRLLAGAQANGAGALVLENNTVSRSICAASTTNSTNSSSSNGAVCSPKTSTTRPRVISYKRISATSMSISWGPDEGSSTFMVEYGMSDGDWRYNSKVTGFQTILHDLPSGKPIWVRVAVTDNCTIGSYSQSVLAGSPLFPNTGIKPTTNFLSPLSRWLNMFSY